MGFRLDLACIIVKLQNIKYITNRKILRFTEKLDPRPLEVKCYRMQVELDSTHCHPIHSKDETKSTCKKEKKPFQVRLNGMGDALHKSKMFTNDSLHVGHHETMGGVILGADYHFAKHLYAGLLGLYKL